MKNIMIKQEIYDRLKAMKGGRSFSDTIQDLMEETVENKRKGLRLFFGTMNDGKLKESKKLVQEVFRGGKGRLF